MHRLCLKCITPNNVPCIISNLTATFIAVTNAVNHHVELLLIRLYFYFQCMVIMRVRDIMYITH